ncbi:MAG: hypothetical protein JW733_03300 [Coriobacteriia bacterium]|nr:hypothetical protein [Coriobacteriia bacterium]
MVLSTPKADQARHFTRVVDSTQAFVATIMSPSAGARVAHLYSLEMVDRFLEAHTIEDFQAVGLRLDIHYADFVFLADWFEEVIGDAELATAIREVHVTGEAFGVLVPRVKRLLRERQQQCEEVLEPGIESATSS